MSEQNRTLLIYIMGLVAILAMAATTFLCYNNRPGAASLVAVVTLVAGILCPSPIRKSNTDDKSSSS